MSGAAHRRVIRAQRNRWPGLRALPQLLSARDWLQHHRHIGHRYSGAIVAHLLHLQAIQPLQLGGLRRNCSGRRGRRTICPSCSCDLGRSGCCGRRGRRCHHGGLLTCCRSRAASRPRGACFAGALDCHWHRRGCGLHRRAAPCLAIACRSFRGPTLARVGLLRKVVRIGVFPGLL